MSEQKKDIYRKIESFLTGNSLSPIPTNYTVAYTYLQQHSVKLNEVIDQHLKKHSRLNETFIQQAFSEFIQHPDFNADEIYPALQALLSDVYSVVETSQDSSSSFLQTLHSTSDQLDESQTKANIATLVQLLKASTDSMVESQEKLYLKLQQAEQESENLQARLNSVSQAAMLDDLTGLLNRAGLRKKLEDLSIELGSPFEASHYSVVVFDLDKFKNINDTYGHPFGDRVLGNTGSLILKHIRGGDLAVRFGGEEFIVILPETDRQGARQVAEKIRLAIGNVRWTNKRTNEKLAAITISAGIAEAMPNSTLNDVIQIADDALYQAKKNGRNCCYPIDISKG